MSNIVIKVADISKQYRLGDVGTGSMKDDFKRFRYNLIGKEDPFLTIGEENDRSSSSKSDYVWALRNINFEVKHGEILGIIGRNGAGKSTLLKILSRTTGPTIGSVKMKGRIASLLEVGTGFHGELSGRENIYLNGAIMGLRKHEITKKLDEIIDFAGVERYIDTPVKRYSSGMYVRLAFAVAAHLEPDIMIVDEVLAVGDAEFQKKCLGKMKDVSNKEGRTVLFVSHNMTAIKTLCNRTLLLENGQLVADGETHHIVNKYFQFEKTGLHKIWTLTDAPGTEEARLLEVKLTGEQEVIYIEKPFDINFKAWIKQKTLGRLINFSLVIYNSEEVAVFNVGTGAKQVNENIVEATCHIPAHFMNDDHFSIRILLVEDSSRILFDLNGVLNFKMEEGSRDSNWHGKWIGAVRPTELIKWTY